MSNGRDMRVQGASGKLHSDSDLDQPRLNSPAGHAEKPININTWGCSMNLIFAIRFVRACCQLIGCKLPNTHLLGGVTSATDTFIEKEPCQVFPKWHLTSFSHYFHQKKKSRRVFLQRNKSTAYLASIKIAIIIAYYATASLFAPNAYATGSFSTTGGYSGNYSLSGFSSIEDAAEWACHTSMTMPWGANQPAPPPYYFTCDGGIEYLKITDHPAPPGSGHTNYWWRWIYLGGNTYPYHSITYNENTPPVTKNLAPPDSCPTAYIGNPVHLSLGDKSHQEKDSGEPNSDLIFVRYYHSSHFAPKGSMGWHWRHTFDSKIKHQAFGVNEFAYVTDSSGKQFTYQLIGGKWISDADITNKLTRLIDLNGNRLGWQLFDYSTGQIKLYDTSGKFLGVEGPREGRNLLLSHDENGRILSVADNHGRSIRFVHDTSGRISSLTDPALGIITYNYDAQSNLTRVTYPDGASKTYHYEDSRFPHALTGITDENGDRYATYAYDEQGRANLSEHAGGADRVTLTYNPDGTTTVTDPLGMPRTHTFTTLHGVIKITGQSQPGGSGCGPASSQMAYDINGNIASRTDFNGNRTCHVHDLSRNLETLRLEGLGNAVCPASLAGHVIPAGSLQRKIHTEWHPDWQLPTRRAEPLKRVNQRPNLTTHQRAILTRQRGDFQADFLRCLKRNESLPPGFDS